MSTLRKIVKFVQAEMREPKKKKFLFLIEIWTPSPLLEMGTRQDSQNSLASTAVHALGASDVRVCACCSRLFRKEEFVANFSELHYVFGKQFDEGEGVGRDRGSKDFSEDHQSFDALPRAAHLSECMADKRLQLKKHSNTGCRTERALPVVIWA